MKVCFLGAQNKPAVYSDSTYNYFKELLLQMLFILIMIIYSGQRKVMQYFSILSPFSQQEFKPSGLPVALEFCQVGKVLAWGCIDQQSTAL